MAAKKGIFKAPGGQRQERESAVRQTPKARTTLLAASVPESTKDLFDELAHRLKIPKKELMQLMVEAYAERYDLR